MRRAAAAILTTLLTSGPAAAEGWLGLPVDCRLGVDCWTLQYFDHDPGAGARDYACGGRAYDGHKGVDIGVATEADIARNVAVVAAAPGRVKATRDGEPDRLALDQGVAALPSGKDCGNGVVIDHGEGWETQYCHMKRGSVAVAPDDRVEPGDRLGAIGLSGRTQFPHAHLSVRHQGRPIDPFAPHGLDASRCAPSADQLWSDAAARALTYDPTALVAVGLAEGRPALSDAAAGAYDAGPIDRNAGILSVWTLIWHVAPGDDVTLSARAPNGDEVLGHTVEIERGRLRQFLYVGARAKGAWPVGTYDVRAVISRDGEEIGRRDADITVR